MIISPQARTPPSFSDLIVSHCAKCWDTVVVQASTNRKILCSVCRVRLIAAVIPGSDGLLGKRTAETP